MVSNAFHFLYGQMPHDKQTTYLDEQLRKYSERNHLLVESPLNVHEEDRARLKQFLKVVCLEDGSNVEEAEEGASSIAAATTLKEFVKSFDFHSIYVPVGAYCSMTSYGMILDHLKHEMVRLITDYHTFQISVMMIGKIPGDDQTTVKSGEWLQSKLQTMAEDRMRASKPFLASLGWKLPKPYQGHEIIGLVQPKASSQNQPDSWKLHIIDTSGVYTNSKGYKPCSIRINYTTPDELVQNLKALTPLQLSSLNQKKVEALRAIGIVEHSNIQRQFQSAVYTHMKGSLSEKHSFDTDRPLSYFVHRENRGCTFNFFKPLLCVVAKDYIKKQQMTLTVEEQQNVKILAEVLDLAFKFYCFDKLCSLLPVQERDDLSILLNNQKQQLWEANSHNPFMNCLKRSFP